jgi:hypothetical protein
VKCIIYNEVVLSRTPDGPLAAHIGAFAERQSAQGYARSSIRRQILLAAGFSHWLKQQGVALRHVSSGHLSRYLRDRARGELFRSGALPVGQRSASHPRRPCGPLAEADCDVSRPPARPAAHFFSSGHGVKAPRMESITARFSLWYGNVVI